MKLNIKAFAATCGLVWGFAILLITWWIILLDGSTGEVTWIGRVYRGYEISFAGSLIGFVWALVDGTIGGAIFAWLYNWIQGKLKTQEE
ncbi:MAG: bacteriophage holin [Puniceicoccaceae bacterium]